MGHLDVRTGWAREYCDEDELTLVFFRGWTPHFSAFGGENSNFGNLTVQALKVLYEGPMRRGQMTASASVPNGKTRVLAHDRTNRRYL